MPINSSVAWALVATLAIAMIALVLNLQLAAFVGFFIILGFWSWQQPLPALYLLIIVAPLLPMLKITQTAGTMTLLKDVIILTLFFKLVVVPLATKQLAYRRNILLAPLVALVVWVSIGVLQADSLLLGLLRARDIVLYVLLYFVILNLPRRRGWYKEALTWFLVSVAIVGAFGWYQFFVVPASTVLRFDPARQIWIPRVSSIMAHPSILGQYLVTASTLLVALLPFARRRTAPALVALAVFLLPLVYFTFSRAVWLGYAAGLAAMAVVYTWTKIQQTTRTGVPWKIGTMVLIGIIIAFASAVQFTSLGVFVRSAFDPTYTSNAERLEFLVRLIAPVTATPALFGAGLGDVIAQNFRSVDITTFDVASGSSRAVQLAKNATLVDNQYLKTFIELGLAGLLIYAWLYWRVARAAFGIANYELRIPKITGLWSLGFLAAFLIQGFFIDIWDIFPTNMAFWIVAALVSREQVPYTSTDEED